jgi:hypothetical protein
MMAIFILGLDVGKTFIVVISMLRSDTTKVFSADHENAIIKKLVKWCM